MLPIMASTKKNRRVPLLNFVPLSMFIMLKCWNILFFTAENGQIYLINIIQYLKQSTVSNAVFNFVILRKHQHYYCVQCDISRMKHLKTYVCIPRNASTLHIFILSTDWNHISSPHSEFFHEYQLLSRKKNTSYEFRWGNFHNFFFHFQCYKWKMSTSSWLHFFQNYLHEELNFVVKNFNCGHVHVRDKPILQ
jgi:hypothetical protein